MKSFVCIVLFASLAVGATPKDIGDSEKKPNDLLIDDFGVASKQPKPLRDWKFIADQVMGGKSTGKMDIVKYEDRNCLHMTGDISLENNGGFIQCRSFLRVGRKMFDANEFNGIMLKLRGNGQKYAVHLRTSSTWLPWQYYEVKFETTNDWQQVKLPFKDFKPHSLKKSFNKNKIKSIAIVAIGEEMKADIYIDEVFMYGK